MIRQFIGQKNPTAIKCVLVLICLLVGDSLRGEESTIESPNVILIITDDQGYGDVGAHGNEMIQTPHLDQLAENAFRLTNFHVDPTCAETRSALMTGRYSSRTGVWHTIMGRSILRRDEITVADVFRANGYRTGMFGKWHLGDNHPYLPNDRGFQETLYHGGGGVGQTPDVWGNDYFDDRYFRNGEIEQHEGYCTDVFFDAALEFIDQSSDSPFFVYLSTNAPHGPYLVEDRYAEPYREQGVPETMAKFYGMITNIDENVGRLEALLERKGLKENTLLIFMTDNGTAAGFNERGNPNDGWVGFNAGMRGRKGSQYDGGHRVPCFMRLPNQNIVSGHSEELSAHIDLLPTLIDCCQLTPPRGVSFDGVSRLPLMIGEATETVERTLFVHSQRIDHPEFGRKCSVMTQQWRLVDLKELYDITEDPGQQNNVAENHPDVVEQLTASYGDWWESISRRFDEYCEIDFPAEAGVPSMLTSHDWHPTQGGVPWNQNMIRNDPNHNGYWAIRVLEDGVYRMTLRTRPPGEEVSLAESDGVGRIRIGDQEVRASFEGGATEVAIETEIRAGSYQFQSWLTRDNDETRGAYFIVVERLDESRSDTQALELRDGDCVALLGGTFIERMQMEGYVESYLIGANPNLDIKVRNLGWSGDDVFGTARAVFGTVEEGYQRRLVDVQKAMPTVAVLAYGDNESFGGTSELRTFTEGYNRLLDDLSALGIRLVLVAPPRMQNVGSPLPDPRQWNQRRAVYRDAIEQIASERELPFVDFFEPLTNAGVEEDGTPIIRDRISDNGIHLNAYGYWRVAPEFCGRLGHTIDTMEIVYDCADQSIESVAADVIDSRNEEGVISITVRESQIPYAEPPATRPRGGQMMAQHDVIKVLNLAPGRYGLNIDGAPTLLATHEQWHDGVFIIRSDYLDESRMLRELAHKKNEYFFHHYRPQNETYLFLFRKHEQGNNAGEVDEFLPLIEEIESQVATLRAPRTHRYQIVRLDD